jgi:hypothetical protein
VGRAGREEINVRNGRGRKGGNECMISGRGRKRGMNVRNGRGRKRGND